MERERIISMERMQELLDIPVEEYSSDQMEAVQELAEAITKAMQDLIPAIQEAVGAFTIFWNANREHLEAIIYALEDESKRICWLALHARKPRARKKNLHRLQKQRERWEGWP